MVEVAEAEARDLLAEWLGEVEVAVTQEMMHHLLEGLVAVELVGWKVQSF